MQVTSLCSLSAHTSPTHGLGAEQPAPVASDSVVVRTRPGMSSTPPSDIGVTVEELHVHRHFTRPDSAHHLAGPSEVC